MGAWPAESQPPGRPPRTFVLLWLQAFIFWLSFYLLTALLPLYAREGGASDSAIGFIVGVATFASMLVAPLAGSLSDCYGRRPVMIVGALIFALCSASYAWSAAVAVLLGLRSLHGLGVGLATTAHSGAAADITPPDQRGSRLGALGAAMNLALALGPIAGLWLAGHVSFAMAFGVSTLLALIAVLLAFSMRETLARRRAGRFRLASSITRTAVAPGGIALCLAATFGMQFAFVPLYSAEQGLNSGIFFASLAVVMASLRIVGGRLSDRLGRALVTLVGSAFAAAGLLTLAAVPGPVGLALSGLLYGTGLGMAHSTLMAWSVDRSPDGDYGKAVGTYHAAYQFGFAIGAAASGVIITAFGYRATFIGAAALVLGATMGVLAGQTRPTKTLTETRTGP